MTYSHYNNTVAGLFMLSFSHMFHLAYNFLYAVNCSESTSCTRISTVCFTIQILHGYPVLRRTHFWPVISNLLETNTVWIFVNKICTVELGMKFPAFNETAVFTGPTTNRYYEPGEPLHILPSHLCKAHFNV